MGELKRVDDSVQLSVAHDQPRRVAVHTRHADDLLKMSDQNEEKAYYEPKVKDAQGQLMQANSTVFDAELFSHVRMIIHGLDTKTYKDIGRSTNIE